MTVSNVLFIGYFYIILSAVPIVIITKDLVYIEKFQGAKSDSGSYIITSFSKFSSTQDVSSSKNTAVVPRCKLAKPQLTNRF